MPVPDDIATRLARLFDHMDSRGVLEQVRIYGRTVVKDGTGTPVGRAPVLLGTIRGYLMPGGGSTDTAQEGIRASSNKTLHFPLSGVATDTGVPYTTLLNLENYTARWGRRGTESEDWRFTDYETYGPYAYLTMEAGSTADKAGNVR